jgi:hypothetical protein
MDKRGCVGGLRLKIMRERGTPDRAVCAHVKGLVGAEESKPLFAFEQNVPEGQGGR